MVGKNRNLVGKIKNVMNFTKRTYRDGNDNRKEGWWNGAGRTVERRPRLEMKILRGKPGIPWMSELPVVTLDVLSLESIPWARERHFMESKKLVHFLYSTETRRRTINTEGLFLLSFRGFTWCVRREGVHTSAGFVTIDCSMADSLPFFMPLNHFLPNMFAFHKYVQSDLEIHRLEAWLFWK